MGDRTGGRRPTPRGAPALRVVAAGRRAVVPGATPRDRGMNPM